MAVWQIPIELIPLKWAEENNYNSNSLYDEEGFDTTSAWKSHQPEKDLDEIFTQILPKGESWSEDLTVWGNEESHDIHVWQEDDEIFSIGFRLDLSVKINELMLTLVSVAIKLNCVFFIPGQYIIFQPNVFQLKKYILNSNAAKFIKDPEAFLSGHNHE